MPGNAASIEACSRCAGVSKKWSSGLSASTSTAHSAPSIGEISSAPTS
jgi:hypothetical protein